MQDLRQNKLPKLGSTIKLAGFLGLDVNEENVKEMLERMGVDPTPEMVQEAIGYLLNYGMEFNMSNLYDFLKSKEILSQKEAQVIRKDLRS